MFDSANCLIVEDNAETRSWLKSCVQQVFKTSKLYDVASLNEARSLVSNVKFKLALIDLGLPDGSGLDLIAELNKEQSNCYIVVATIYDDDKNLFAALRSGAKGYILKDQDKDRITSFLKGIQYNRPPISDASSQRMIAHFNNKGSDYRDSGLTPRETDVTKLIAKGCSVEEAASLLELSPDTVKGYVKNIYAKLDVNNRSEITIKAINLGLVDA